VGACRSTTYRLKELPNEPGKYTIMEYTSTYENNKPSKIVTRDLPIQASLQEMRAYVEKMSPHSQTEKQALDLFAKSSKKDDNTTKALQLGVVGMVPPYGTAIAGMAGFVGALISSLNAENARTSAIQGTHPFSLLILSDEFGPRGLQIGASDYPQELQAEVETFNKWKSNTVSSSPFEVRLTKMKAEAQQALENQRQYAQPGAQ
jgi:hypothetical protein